MSTRTFDAIEAVLDDLAHRYEQAPDVYIDLLEQVVALTRNRYRAARLAKFGTQFKPAGESAEESPAPRQFQRFQQVYTNEGYLGYIAGHDKQGKAIVNVVWEAAEYDESNLRAIPGPSIRDAMRT